MEMLIWELTTELSDDQMQAIVFRFQQLRQNFSEGKNVDQEALKNAYPWVPFITRVITWSKARLTDVEAQITACGGTSEIVQALDHEIQGRINAGLIVNDAARTDCR